MRHEAIPIPRAAVRALRAPREIWPEHIAIAAIWLGSIASALFRIMH